MAAAARKEGSCLERILDALGGVRVVALECDVSTWTVRAWLSGARTPSPASQRRLNALARDFGLISPFPQWETGRRAAQTRAAEQIEERLVGRVTGEEKNFGFGVTEEPSGVRAVVHELRPGLRAVKVRGEDGTIEYAICTEDLRPIYLPAKSLEELNRRFSSLVPEEDQ